MGRVEVGESRKRKSISILRAKEVGVLLPLVVLFITLVFLAQNFLTKDNIFSVLRAVSFEGIVAIGMLIVMLTGGLDLSVASNMALTGILASIFMTNGLPTFVSIVLALVGSACVGLMNGFLINKIKLGAIIVTLGMLSVVRGLAYIVTQGMPIVDLPSNFTFLGQGLIGGLVPVPILFFVVISAICHFMLKYTVLGYHFFSVGGNETASRYSGINVERVRYFSYIICSVFAGIGGILLIARLGVAQPSIAVGYELSIIAAVIIGGASLQGGEGSVLGSVIGVLIIGVIRNGLVLMNIGGFYIQFANGMMILAAVIINRLRSLRQ
ncbi:MAG: ABC transporter permease [Spirochaetes bacterium]|nr:ABC transporter permease [Spirochaetota bacterium]